MSSIIASAASLVTNGNAAVEKSERSDARLTVFRAALSKKILSNSTDNSITLDDTHSDQSLEDIALLCNIRHDYVKEVADLNYLGSLVQNLNEISKPAPAPTDLASAFKLLLATSSYRNCGSPWCKNSYGRAAGVDARDMRNGFTSYDKVYYGIYVGGSSFCCCSHGGCYV